MKTTAGTVASSWFVPQFYGNLLQAKGGGGSEGAVVTPYYPLAPLQPWINGYQLATGAFLAQLAQTLKYDWRFWDAAKEGVSDKVIGTVTVQRQPSSSGVVYQIDQLRDSRQMTAKVNCLADDFESVQEWTLEETFPVGGGGPKPGGKGKKGGGGHGGRGEKGDGEALSSSSTGRVDGANAHVTRFGREKVVPLDGPLICSWALMTNPQVVRHLSTSGKKFILADQMSTLRAGYLARPDMDVPVAGGSCGTFLVTGSGSPPTHVIVHPQVGSLFMTLNRTSLVLTSIENAG